MQNWNQWQLPTGTGTTTMPQPPSGYTPTGTDPVAMMQSYMSYFNQPAPSGYTAEQWAAAQQQSWTQWQQWQQQYQQWQAQYGEKYQQSLKQMSTQNLSQAPPLPPPLPKEDSVKPPLPPGPGNSYQFQNVPPPHQNNLPLFPSKSSNNFNQTMSSDYSRNLLSSSNQPPLPSLGNDMISVSKRENSAIGSNSVKKLKNDEEELTEAEKSFDAEFKQWEEKFNTWKQQNANHPDKAQYTEYEAKWTSWREKLLERREQMRKKREQHKQVTLQAEAAKNKELSGGDKIMNILSNSDNQALINNVIGIGKSLSFNGKQDNIVPPPPPPPPSAAIHNQASPVSTQKSTGSQQHIQSLLSQTSGNSQSSNLPPHLAQAQWAAQNWAAQYNAGMNMTNASGFPPQSGSGSLTTSQNVMPSSTIPSNMQSQNTCYNFSQPPPEFSTNDNRQDKPNLFRPSTEFFGMNNRMEFDNNRRDSNNRQNMVFDLKSGDMNSTSYRRNEMNDSLNRILDQENNFRNDSFNTRKDIHGREMDNFGDVQRAGFKRDEGNFMESNFRRDRGNFNLGNNRYEQGGNRFSNENDRFVSTNDRFKSENNRFGITGDRFNSSDERFGRQSDRDSRNDRFNLGNDSFGARSTFGSGERFNPSSDRFGSEKDRFGMSNERFSTGNENFSPGNERFGPGGLNNRFGLRNDRFDEPRGRMDIGIDPFSPNDRFNSERFDQNDIGDRRDNFGRNRNQFEPTNELAPELQKLMKKRQASADIFKPSYLDSERSSNISSLSESFRKITGESPFASRNDDFRKDNWNPNPKNLQNLNEFNRFSNPRELSINEPDLPSQGILRIVDSLSQESLSSGDPQFSNKNRNNVTETEMKPENLEERNKPKLPENILSGPIAQQQMLDMEDPQTVLHNDYSQQQGVPPLQRPSWMDSDFAEDIMLDNLTDNVKENNDEKIEGKQNEEDSKKEEPRPTKSDVLPFIGESDSKPEDLNLEPPPELPNLGPITSDGDLNDIKKFEKPPPFDMIKNRNFEFGPRGNPFRMEGPPPLLPPRFPDSKFPPFELRGMNNLGNPRIPPRFEPPNDRELQPRNFTDNLPDNFPPIDGFKNTHFTDDVRPGPRDFNQRDQFSRNRPENFPPPRNLDASLDLRNSQDSFRPRDFDNSFPPRDDRFGSRGIECPIRPQDFRDLNQNPFRRQGMENPQDKLPMMPLPNQGSLHGNNNSNYFSRRSDIRIGNFNENSSTNLGSTCHEDRIPKFENPLFTKRSDQVKSFPRSGNQEFHIEKQFNYNHVGTAVEKKYIEHIPSKIIDYHHKSRAFLDENLSIGQTFDYNHMSRTDSGFMKKPLPQDDFKRWKASDNTREYYDRNRGYDDRISKYDNFYNFKQDRPRDSDRNDDKRYERGRRDKERFGDEKKWESSFERDGRYRGDMNDSRERAREKFERPRKELSKENYREGDRSKGNVNWQENSNKNIVETKTSESSVTDGQNDNITRDSPKQTLELAKIPNFTMVDDILCPPGRFNRPSKIAIILRGPPGSGKSFVAKLIKDKEVEQGGSAPRILSLDDYFLTEKEVESKDDNGKRTTIKEMVYEYEEAMEPSYITSLVKAFKKNIMDGFFNFIILDCINEKISDYDEMWSFAKSKGFKVYVCEMEMDVQICFKRNIHSRTEDEINRIVDYFEPTPSYHQKLDVNSMLQEHAIEEVHMEDSQNVEEPDSKMNEDSQDSQDDSQDIAGVSKWEKMEVEDKLDRLDGLAKRKTEGKVQTMEDFLQVPDYYNMEDNSGRKRVRWADLEERKEQEKMRAVGFVVGHTNWDRMMDPTNGGSALTRTKYI